MLCIQCGCEIKTKSLKYCSQRCSKNYLKKGYRKRKSAHILAYNRAYREACKNKPISKRKRDRLILKKIGCLRCGSCQNLNVHHIKPLISGGDNNESNLLVLCFDCHMEWEKRMAGYWERNIMYTGY